MLKPTPPSPKAPTDHGPTFGGHRPPPATALRRPLRSAGHHPPPTTPSPKPPFPKAPTSGGRRAPPATALRRPPSSTCLGIRGGPNRLRGPLRHPAPSPPAARRWEGHCA
ncbi:hypothetical protein PVAP13_3NG177519 [Panicum virgatum]|uniref:Uncharacterized protein n=1 Tax=Panicum virgatum TaxID=38727 RepID=A0A8T0U8A4_PANVG|nr:hypothetical protein PVAP13_3NG177519 [Panicum virgatum]